MVTILQREQVRVFKVEKGKYMKLEGKKQLLYGLPSITDQSTFTVVKHKDEGEDWRGDYYKNGYNNNSSNNNKMYLKKTSPYEKSPHFSHISVTVTTFLYL